MVEEMNAEVNEVKHFQRGDVVKGKVTKVEDKQAYVDVGYKTDGIVPISELSSLHVETVSDVLKEGDEIELKVIRINDDEDELVLSKRAVDAERAWAELKEKMDRDDIVEAEVAEVVKGGLVVDLGVRGFIPASLVERYYVEDFSDYVGRTLPVKVIELDQERNKVILSHRAVLEEEEAKARKERLSSLQPGQIIEGTVSRITDFGAFVDIGGIDGLVHISEMAWHRVESPQEVVQEGDKVQVKVLKVDVENEKISLSIKATQPSPWQKAAEEIKPGDTVTGVVKRLVPFGAFVEVRPGVEGLVHISQLATRRVGSPQEVLKEGQEIEAKVLEVNPEEERMSLSIRELQEEQRANDYKQYHEKQSSSSGITLGELVGDQLKKLKQN